MRVLARKNMYLGVWYQRIANIFWGSFPWQQAVTSVYVYLPTPQDPFLIVLHDLLNLTHHLHIVTHHVFIVLHDTPSFDYPSGRRAWGS